MRFCVSARRLATFAVVVVLPEPCRPDHHDGDRRRRIEVDRLRARAQRFDQLVVHDLHDHLAGRDRLDDLDPDRALLYFLGEGARDIERDIGLDQRAAHLLQRRLDVRFRQRAAPGQPVEDRIQTFGKTVEHLSLLTSPRLRGEVENTNTPEGASRCRAVASGLTGRSAIINFGSLARAGGK